MQWNWTLHTQGPDEPVYIIEADGIGPIHRPAG